MKEAAYLPPFLRDITRPVMKGFWLDYAILHDLVCSNCFGVRVQSLSPLLIQDFSKAKRHPATTLVFILKLALWL